MLEVKCLLVLDSFYVTMKDTVVSLNKKMFANFLCLNKRAFIFKSISPLRDQMNNKILNSLSVKVLEIKQMLQLLILCLLGTFSLGSCVRSFFRRWGVFCCPCMKSFCLLCLKDFWVVR